MEAPSSTSVLLDLIHHSNEVLDDQAGAIIVHCSAGVGRTGTFIGLYKLIQDFLDDEVIFNFINNKYLNLILQ